MYLIQHLLSKNQCLPYRIKKVSICFYFFLHFNINFVYSAVPVPAVVVPMVNTQLHYVKNFYLNPQEIYNGWVNNNNLPETYGFLVSETGICFIIIMWLIEQTFSNQTKKKKQDTFTVVTFSMEITMEWVHLWEKTKFFMALFNMDTLWVAVCESPETFRLFGQFSLSWESLVFQVNFKRSSIDSFFFYTKKKPDRLRLISNLENLQTKINSTVIG